MEINKLRINNFDLYHIPNNKFKSFTIGVYFFNPLEEKELSRKSLLSNYLTKYNEKYPTEKALTTYLRSLYGMDLYCSYGRNGLVTTMNFIIRSINDKYLSTDEELLKKAVDVLDLTINKPYFDDKLIDFEKKLLIEDINRLYDNKSQYATRRFLDIMLKDEKCRFSSIGTVEDAKAITKKSLTETYNNMLNSKHIVYVIGDISEEKIKDAFSNFHLKDEISEKLDFIDYETKKIEKVTEVVEEQKIRQSIVLMGYRSEIRLNDDLYNGMFMLSSMLGGYFHSTLFQEIREKRSLAYSVSCDYNPRKGNFAIFAGISASKYDEFKSVVNQIIEDYQNGNIDDNVFELTKKSIISGIYKSADQQTYGIGFVLNEISGIENHTIEEKVNRVLSITKEEVIDAAKCLVLDTIYFLKGTL